MYFFQLRQTSDFVSPKNIGEIWDRYKSPIYFVKINEISFSKWLEMDMHLCVMGVIKRPVLMMGRAFWRLLSRDHTHTHTVLHTYTHKHTSTHTLTNPRDCRYREEIDGHDICWPCTTSVSRIWRHQHNMTTEGTYGRLNGDDTKHHEVSLIHSFLASPC